MSTPDDSPWLTTPAPGAWRADGSCAALPVEVVDELFFPAGETTVAARRLCAGCEVRLDCLDYALDAGDELHGVWAGTSRGERRRLRDNTITPAERIAA